MRIVKTEIEADAVEYKDGVFFIPPYINALFRFDLETKQTELVKILGIPNKENMYRNAYKFKNNAWFIPWESKYILYINLDTLHVRFYEIPYKNINSKGLRTYPHAYYFSSVKIGEKFIFLTPTGTDTAVLINMENSEFKIFEEIIDFEREILWGSAVIGDNVFMSPCSGNRMISLNFKTGEVKSYPWRFDAKQYSGMYAEEDKLFFCPNRANNLLIFDLKREAYEKVYLGELFNENYSYLELIVVDGCLWLLPWFSRYILMYDFNKKEWKYRKKDDEICYINDTEYRMIDYEKAPLFVTCRTGYISKYQKDLKEFINMPVYIDIEPIRNYVSKNLKEINDKFTNEQYMGFEQYIGLDNYLTICSRYY